MFEDIKLKIAYPSLETQFIDWLDKEEIFKKSAISSVYMPAWREDYGNARSWMSKDVDTREKYNAVMKRVFDSGIDVEVLLQGINVVPDDVLKRYLSMGVKKFTIANDASAYRLKELDPNVFISASITKALSPDEIINNDYSMYDEICLFFWYTLNLSTVESLPDKYEYSMCGNSGCSPVCTQCINHWLSNEMGPCRFSSERSTNNSLVGMHYGEYVRYFKKYISRIKILDRLDSTEHLINAIRDFFDLNRVSRPHSYFDRKMGFPNIINKDKINRPMCDTGKEGCNA